MNKLLPIYLTAEFTLKSSCCNVFNINQISDYIWIKLPKEESRLLSLADMYDENTSEHVDFDCTTCIRDGCKPWLQFDTTLLNLSVGYHKYVMQFVNKHTDDSVFMYFHYYIQDTNVDKPYVYMDKGVNDVN